MSNTAGKKAMSVRGGDFQPRPTAAKTNSDRAGNSFAAKKPRLSPATAKRHHARQSARNIGVVTAKAITRLIAAIRWLLSVTANVVMKVAKQAEATANSRPQS